MTTVARAVGRTLAGCGARMVFGVVGSGNFHLTNAMVEAGARFVAARHEMGAATMADAYARMSGEVAVVSVHQGCGLTNAVTGIAEAAKSRTPLVVVTGESTDPRSNFAVDQPALVESVGAQSRRVTSAATAVAETVEAVACALHQRRTVLLNVPLDVQELEVPDAGEDGAATSLPAAPPPVAPDPAQMAGLVELLAGARAPVFIGGRGARSAPARRALEALAERCGALLGTSAVAKGLFAREKNPWNLDIIGGFATPLAVELLGDADVVVAWGCSLTKWTTRHGRIFQPRTTLVQVDDTPEVIGRNGPVGLGVVGDVQLVAEAALAALNGPEAEHRPASGGYRTDAVRERIALEGKWNKRPYADNSGDGRIDPRLLTIGLNRILPAERIVATDAGNFQGYPAVFWEVPDEGGFCHTQSFQSVGLGLATAVGAGLARPDRLAVAAVGDGGLLMSVAELDTVIRLGLPLVVLVYNDDAYGAEVHHFGPAGHPLHTVQFPDTDLAAIARGYGFEAVTVRSVVDLDGVASWVNGDRSRPLLIDAKVTTTEAAWWLEEAFRSH